MKSESSPGSGPTSWSNSNEDFFDLFEEAPIPYIHEGLDSKFIHANRAARELLGLQADEVASTLGSSLVADTPESQKGLKSTLDAIANGREAAGLLLEMRRRDNGRSIWVEWSSKPARSGLYTRSMLVDVTQRVLLEQAKAALEFSLESGQVGEWDLDLVKDTSRRSFRYDQCFGYSQPIPDSEWGAATALQHVHIDDRTRVKSTLQEAIRTQLDWRSEFRVVWSDSSIHWLAARGKVYRTNADGVPLRMLGIVMDITERKRTEEALAASERLARSHVDALTQTLEALTLESAPDRLLQHVMRAMTTQLSAHSCSVWQRDGKSDQAEFLCLYEDGKYLTRTEPSLPRTLGGNSPWHTVFLSGKLKIIEDVRSLEESPWRRLLMSSGVTTLLLIPMSVAHRVQGAISVRFNTPRAFRREELDLAQALANQAMLSMQLSRLSAQGRESAINAERNRMARDIHDTLAQGLTGVIVQLEAATDATSKGLVDESGMHILRAQGLARETLTAARRSVRALRPQELDDNEMLQALDLLIEKMTAGTMVKARCVSVGAPIKLSSEWEANFLRIVQEILTNVLRHSGASHFEARIEYHLSEVRLELSDNGCGFDPVAKSAGFGLIGIRERVSSMGGALTIKSMLGQGARFLIALPLERPQDVII